MFGIPSIYVYLIAGVSAIALLGGVYAAGDIHGHNSCIASQVQAANKQTAQIIVQTKTVAVDNVAREQQLQTTINQLSSQRDNLQKELLSANTPNVNLSTGDVSVLNSAISGDSTVLPRPQPGPSDAQQATTSLTQYIQWGIDTSAQYNSEAARCDTLRDFILKEQLGVDKKGN